jgi:hypothetical protein
MNPEVNRLYAAWRRLDVNFSVPSCTEMVEVEPLIPATAGFVTRFAVTADYLGRFPVKTVGGAIHTEYWVPAADLPEFNSNIVGNIEVVDSFPSAGSDEGR